MYPNEYIQFLAHFHGDRDYFECHEILEEYWKKSNSKDKDSIWVGFILLAVSNYHHRRANFKGAKRTLDKAIKIFTFHERLITSLGINELRLFPLLNNRLAAINKGENYKSYLIPMGDPNLLEACKDVCIQKGFQWGKDSDLANIDIVHRHKLRDRSGVIAERQEAIKNKRGGE